MADANSDRSRSRFGAGSTEASGGEFGAALAATGTEDGATRTSTHAETEAVGLGPTTSVGLERTLAHGESLLTGRTHTDKTAWFGAVWVVLAQRLWAGVNGRHNRPVKGT